MEPTVSSEDAQPHQIRVLSTCLQQAAANFSQDLCQVSKTLQHISYQDRQSRARGVRRLGEALAFAAQATCKHSEHEGAPSWSSEVEGVLAKVSTDVQEAIDLLRANLLAFERIDIIQEVPEPNRPSFRTWNVSLPWGDVLKQVVASTASCEEIMWALTDRLQVPRPWLHQLRLGKSIGDSKELFTKRLAELQSECKPGDGVELLATFDVIPKEYVGCCAAWAQNPRIQLPKMFSQLGHRISSTEMRGITLLQLEAVADLAHHVTTLSEITDRSGRSVKYKKLRSLDTGERSDSESSEASCDEGEAPKQTDRVLNLVTGAAMDIAAHTHERVELNMYHIDAEFVKPLTRPFFCSLVELVATDEQPPKVMVSHYWGNPFWQLLRLLRLHARERQLQISDAVWICTFANNQHDLCELQGDLKTTPFYKVMRLPGCLGTVAILDGNTVPFTRIWCVLESFISTDEVSRAAGKFYDLAAWIQIGAQMSGDQEVPPQGVLQLDSGDGTFADRAEDADVSFAVFPMQVARRGFGIDLLSAEASRDSDRRNILHFIAGTADALTAVEPPTEHPNYEALNLAVRKRFLAGAAYDMASDDATESLRGLLSTSPAAALAAMADGGTPLHAAALSDSQECFKLLLRANADINAKAVSGETPLICATYENHPEIVEMCLKAGAEVDACDNTGYTPLMHSAELKEASILLLLLGARADVNLIDNDSQAAHHWAVAASRNEPLDFLLKAQADVNCVDGKGRSALHLAARKEDESTASTVTVLLKHGADVSLKTKKGKTAEEIAAKLGNDKFLAALQQFNQKATNKNNKNEEPSEDVLEKP